jgi:nitrate/TMAO reductase-like tetraheme cytochrome c subunit
MWQKLRASLTRFFFPPAGAPMWVRLLPYATLGVLTLILLSGAAYGWEYTNSPEFCGTSCHTMPPEYTAYLTSPHARVACVDCHIGKGFITTRVTRKAGDLKHVFATAFHTYEFPIRAGELRPARETCEKCHFPEKFSDDSLRITRRYLPDKNNTPTDIYLSLKTGGGSQRQGLGRGIHWHIENKIAYLPGDEEEQTIPYVQITNSDGTTTEYVDIGAQVDSESIDPAKLKQMDCITCHNRITHLVPTPTDTIDRLMQTGVVASDIPEIRKKAMEVYSQVFNSTQVGVNAIGGLEGYYQTYYPDYYQVNQEKIRTAVTALQQAYGNSVYPEQNSDWNSHPNNIGHKDSPGCFRCHDGKHMDKNQNAIRLECNLCHSVPVVAGPYDYVTHLEISRGPEPQGHKNPNWISIHNKAFDQSCSNCHDTKDPGGTSNSSFCSNSACHGSTWTFAGFDAPKLREVIQAQLPPTPTPQPLPAGGPLTYTDTVAALLTTRCGSCHGEGAMKGLNVTTYETLMKGGQDGPAINPGDPENSLLVQKQSGPLPHFGQLSPDELDLIIQWIKEGAPL